jgi:hypothetical protein
MFKNVFSKRQFEFHKKLSENGYENSFEKENELLNFIQEDMIWEQFYNECPKAEWIVKILEIVFEKNHNYQATALLESTKSKIKYWNNIATKKYGENSPFIERGAINILKNAIPMEFGNFCPPFSQIFPKYKQIKRFWIRLEHMATEYSWEEFYHRCEDGQWLLEIFKLSNPNDTRKLVLAQGHCANVNRDMVIAMNSISAIDIAIAYGEGRVNACQLKEASYLAWNIVKESPYFPEINQFQIEAITSAYAAVRFDSSTWVVRGLKQKEQLEIIKKYLPIDYFDIQRNAFTNLKF